jgi:hypothetical protein
MKLEYSKETIRLINKASDLVHHEIKQQLQEEGNHFDEGWSYDQCRLVLGRLNDEDFSYALLLIDMKSADFTTYFLDACRDENEIRTFESILRLDREST